MSLKITILDTLKKAISQIQGAERKLFKSNKSITLDHPNNGKFLFDPSKYKKVIRFIVNHSNSPKFYPGIANTKNNGLIHIFNWDAFSQTLTELNTVSDLVFYIEKRSLAFDAKQVLIQNQKLDPESKKLFEDYFCNMIDLTKETIIIEGSELDLLANYLLNEKVFDFTPIKETVLVSRFNIEGCWKRYISSIEVSRKAAADSISYFIDEFIKKEILYYNDKERRLIAAEILSLTRQERRLLGIRFDQNLKKYQNGNDYLMVRTFATYSEIGIFIHGNGIKLQESMTLINIASRGYSHYERYKSKKIIMIGINSKTHQCKFEFTPEVKKPTILEEKDLEYNLKKLKWFQNVKQIEVKSKEYTEK